jgi:hypothetical protein
MPQLIKLDPELKAALEIVCDLAKPNALSQKQSDAVVLVEHALLSGELPQHMGETDAYADHVYCAICRECITCNLRPCRDGGAHHEQATI